jgi:hypothetical protein
VEKTIEPSRASLGSCSLLMSSIWTSGFWKSDVEGGCRGNDKNRLYLSLDSGRFPKSWLPMNQFRESKVERNMARDASLLDFSRSFIGFAVCYFRES